jgi:hypothetical protein
VGRRDLSGRLVTASFCPPAHECAPTPLEIFREALELFRRAGLAWFYAYTPAYEAALSVADEREYDEWVMVLQDTQTVWMRAFENRDTGVKL